MSPDPQAPFRWHIWGESTLSGALDIGNPNLRTAEPDRIAVDHAVVPTAGEAEREARSQSAPRSDHLSLARCDPSPRSNDSRLGRGDCRGCAECGEHGREAKKRPPCKSHHRPAPATANRRSMANQMIPAAVPAGSSAERPTAGEPAATKFRDTPDQEQSIPTRGDGCTEQHPSPCCDSHATSGV